MSTFKGKSLTEIRELLAKASYHYYSLNESIISDQEYDEMEKWYSTNFPEDPINYTIGAPLPKNSEWKKAKHKIAMSSLNKVNTPEEFFAWCDKIGASLLVVSEKLDGISIDLEYENGILQKAITRGEDGKIGEDITVNVVRMQGVRTELPIPYDGSIRGEVILKEADFNTINEIREMRGEKPYTALRNAASGIARGYDGQFVEFCTVKFYNCTKRFPTISERFIFLYSDLELQTAHVMSPVSPQVVIDIHKKYENETRASLDYEIDGLVVEVDDMELMEDLGNQNHNPLGAVAFKFGSIKKQTILDDVTWQMGKSGRITPVAELRPVKMGGVTVKRASLHNIEMYNELALRKGDHVIVSRRNDVIPYIESVIKHFSKPVIGVPDTCPVCGGEAGVEGKFLVCKNPDCEGKEVGNLKKWVKTLDLKGIGPGIIDALYEANLVETIDQLYTMSKEDIARLEGFGKSSANKIVTTINSKKDIPLREFFGGLNIPNWGRRMFDLLIEAGCETLDDVIAMRLDQLVQIKGIEEKTAMALINGLYKKADTIKRLLEVGVTIQKPQKKEKKMASKTSEITGKSFVFTGKILREDDEGKRFTRNMLQDIVIENGGKTPSSVTKGVDYLVQADPSSQSTKTKKAVGLGVEILSEEDFFKMAGM